MRQLALSLETHRNHYLFSDHYLNEVLPRQAIWREAQAEALEVLAAITPLYRRQAAALPHYNESQTELHWMRPVLDLLGQVYEVQPPLPEALGAPDYAFFPDPAARQAAAPLLGKAAYWEGALAVGDAKRWDRPLDRRIANGAPDAFSNANPCYQIDYYLRRTGRAWGMLTNGRRWRLYHRDSSFRLDVFFEVDLVQLIEQGDLAAWRYFYLFFRAAAFRPDPQGRCWLDEVLDESAAYAVRIGDALKVRVYEALRRLAQGFLDYPTPAPPQSPPQAGGTVPSVGQEGPDLSQLYDACLILLYRLLFLLYAESRGLLPLDDASYAGQYSLKAIKEDIARKLDAGVVFMSDRATIWDNLRALFDIIYRGQAALGVPAYDGRLFDPARYPFLEERVIGDRHLAAAIDLLSRAQAGPGQGLSFVDYRDLSIRHLGSIYEGLLEYKLQTSEVSQALRAELQGEASEVSLVTDRGERKATGSYYTPDYIVKYIVEQTLGPLVDAQARAVEAEIAALNARNPGPARRTPAYQNALARLQNSFAGRVLALNVLDPAMGSGHFLVEATDYLARRIVEAGASTDGAADGSARLTGTGAVESELSYWRRRVVECCIYGVDLNPLAVELAKLSLWLATVARGKPLSFLDHHLRCGNSLIGARAADLQAPPARKKKKTSEVSKTSQVSQLALWDDNAFTQDMFRVVGAMRRIGEYETADLISVKEKEQLFEETVERERRKWRAIADLWTAAYFGLELPPELYHACVQYAQGKPVLLGAAQAEALLQQAHELWQDRRFFHWEIEFPEVFFDEYGRHKGEAAGFDAVVGNPPYGMLQPHNTEMSLIAYLRQAFATAAFKIDLFQLFIEMAIEWTVVKGGIGLIVPNTILTNTFSTDLRALVLSNCAVSTVVTTNSVIFPDAQVNPAIVVFEKRGKGQPMADQVISVLAHEDDRPFSEVLRTDTPWRLRHKHLNVFDGDTWCIRATDAYASLVEKLKAQSRSLGAVCWVNRGLITGDRNKFMSTTRVDKRWLPIITGTDVMRYAIQPATEYVLFERPSTAGGCWDPEVHFHSNKIVLRQIGAFPFGSIDAERYAVTGNIFVLRSKIDVTPHFLLAIINSNLVRRVWEVFLRDYKRVFTELKGEWLERLPIPRIAFTTLAQERARLVEEALALYHQGLDRLIPVRGW